MRLLKPLLLITDLGFVAYWSVIALDLVPAAYMFADYHDPALVAWNWSFLLLDLLVSATGLTGLWLRRKGLPSWRGVVLVSLVLTSCAGLQAVSFWALRGDFELAWWLPNLFLLFYLPYFVFGLLRARSSTAGKG
ncbi:MAG: DUF5360 family protein [Rubrobacter sp.]